MVNRQQARPFLAVAKRDDLEALRELIEAGKVTPVIDSEYSLTEGAEAFARFDDGHTRGKIVISVAGDGDTPPAVD
jgi:NADPH:quinone reductase-like Zn-dependent oxidoreductase